MQPLTASEIDEVLDLLASGERDISRETISRLCVQARLAPQWRPGSEPPDTARLVTGSDGGNRFATRYVCGRWYHEAGVCATCPTPDYWTELPKPPAAPGEGEKA